MDKSKVVILTKGRTDGESLLECMRQFDESFSSLNCLTKEDIINDTSLTKEVTDVFSTWYMPSFTEKEICEYFPHLQNVYYAAGTVKYFAIPFLKNKVRVFSARRANGIPVAEYAAAQIILSNKGYFQAQRAYGWPMLFQRFQKARSFAERKNGNFNANIGIIGCGAIGSMVVQLLKCYELNIYVYDPYLSDERAEQMNVKKVSLQELFIHCDVISNHLPDTSETRGMLNYSFFSTMKPTATFINTGRGKQVVEKDLAKVLRKNQDMCALLDVTTHEPLYPWNPLYRCSNVFLTPHIAGSLSGEVGRMVESMIHAYHNIASGIGSDTEIFIDNLASKA